MASTTQRPPAHLTLPARFRQEIDASVAAGASLESLVLRLTRIDASRLKRDPEVALADISFGPDGMRYLGVRVDEGGVSSSVLETGSPAPPKPAAVRAAPRKPSRAKPKAKAAAPASAAGVSP